MTGHCEVTPAEALAEMREVARTMGLRWTDMAPVAFCKFCDAWLDPDPDGDEFVDLEGSTTCGGEPHVALHA